MVVNERTDVELKCEATGRPEPSITWLKNGKPVETNDYFVVGKIFYYLFLLLEQFFVIFFGLRASFYDFS